MPLILLRHPQPDVAPGICYGASDLALLRDPASDAERLARDLPPVDRIVTSPLGRCRALADALAECLGLPATIDATIAEMDFGDWEGQSWDDIPRPQIDAWAGDFFDARPHGGESVADVMARVRQALSKAERGTTLWVSHLGVYRVALACLGAPDPWNVTLGFSEFRTLPEGDATP